MLEIWQFYTCVPKTTTIWGTVPEIHSETHIIFRHFEPFLPFYPCNNPENQNFEKMKNVSGDIIILQMCDKNNSHMMYAFQDKECDRQFFLSFWAIFYQFISLTTWKIKIFKKWKKATAFWDMERQTGRVFFLILDHFLPFYQPHCPTSSNPTTSQKSKILKKWETPGDIIIL